MSGETYEIQEAAADVPDEPARGTEAAAPDASAAEAQEAQEDPEAHETADAAQLPGVSGVSDASGAADAPDVPDVPEGVAALELKPALEAVLMVVDEPATEEHLAKVLQRRRREISDTLRELADEYDRQRRGFELRLVAEGWRFYTRAEFSEAVESFVLDGQQARLTQAALETLAVVAYRQPVSRSRVSAVRGVNCDGVMRTLLQRGLVQEAGAEPETGAILYTTTHYFLERLGLRGLDELPELAPFLPEADAVEGDSQEGVPSFDVDADDGGDAVHDRTQTEH
jgi:segregation and condensation protein B